MKCNANRPTLKQKKIIKEECKKQFNEYSDRYNEQVCIQILHILRFEYGFGQTRLERFAEKLSKMQTEIDDRYELEKDCTWKICKKQLIDSGIDLERIV